MTQRLTSRFLMDTLNNLLEETKADRKEFKELIESRTKSLKEAETRTLNLQAHLVQRMVILERGNSELLKVHEMEPLQVLKDLTTRAYNLEKICTELTKKNSSLEAKNKTIEAELEAIKSLIYKKVTT